MTCENIITKIGEQKMMVAASPTGRRAKPIKMHVTVMQPIRPKTRSLDCIGQGSGTFSSKRANYKTFIKLEKIEEPQEK